MEDGRRNLEHSRTEVGGTSRTTLRQTLEGGEGQTGPERCTALLIVNEPTPPRLPAQGHHKDVCLGRSEATGWSMYTHVHGEEDSRAGSPAPNASSGNSCSLPPNEHIKPSKRPVTPIIPHDSQGEKVF